MALPVMPGACAVAAPPPAAAPLPDPASIDEQKQAYSRSLDLQLEHGNASLKAQNDERKRQLYEAAEQRKQALILQIDQAMKVQEMALDEQTHQAMMQLKQAFYEQRAALDHQAASLTLEYQQRKMHEEFASTQAEMQRQYLENQQQLAYEAKKFAEQNQLKLPEGVKIAQPQYTAQPQYAAPLTSRQGPPLASSYVLPATGAPLTGSGSYVAVPAYRGATPVMPATTYSMVAPVSPMSARQG